MSNIFNIVDEIRKQRYLDNDYVQVSNIEELIKNFIVEEDTMNYFLENSNLFLETINEFDLKLSNFYVAKHSPYSFIWDTKILYVDSFIVGPNFFIADLSDFEKVCKSIKKIISSNPKKAISYSPSSLKIENFIRNYQNFDKEDLKDIFLDIYSSIENDYDKLKDIFYKIFTKGTYSKDDFNIMNCPVEFIDNETIIIYRGVHSESLDIEKAFSWTTSYETAKWFSNRRGTSSSGKIFKANIKIKDIYCINCERNENEVLIEYSDLINIEEI